MTTTKVENSSIQLASAVNIRNIWSNIVINVKAYGAKGDGKHDDSAAINRAISAAQESYYEALIYFPSGDYRISSPIIVKHGFYPHNINIQGYGARLVATTAGMTMMHITNIGPIESFGYVGQTRLFGLSFYGGGAGSTCIQIGKAGSDDTGLSGGPLSIVQDCFFENYSFGVVVSSVRLFQFKSCLWSTAISGSVGLSFLEAYGTFCGDCWVIDCQIASPLNGSAVVIKASATNSGIAGIHFTDTVIYGPGIGISTTISTSSIQDIFITSCVWDGQGSGIAMLIEQAAGSTIAHIQMSNPWMNGYDVGIVAKNASAITIMGGKFSSTNFQAIDFERCTSTKIIGATFVDVNKNGNGGGIVKLGGVGNRNKVIGCDFVNTFAYSNQFILIESGQVKPIVTNNTADSTGLINNNVSGAEGTGFIMAGNLS